MSFPGRGLIFILLMLQVGFGLVLGAALVLLGLVALPAGLPLGVFTLVTALGVLLLALGGLRGWLWARYAALVFEGLLILGSVLSLMIKPDLLALLTGAGLPAAVSWLLVYRWRRPPEMAGSAAVLRAELGAPATPSS